MEHEINISKTLVSLSTLVPDTRKSQLYISTRGENIIKNEMERIHNVLKKSTKYKGISVYYYEVDWYDSHVDVYEYPSFSLARGKRKATVSYDTTGTIPKEWMKVVDIKFDKVTRLAPIVEAMKQLGIYTSEREKAVRKAFKKNQEHDEYND